MTCTERNAVDGSPVLAPTASRRPVAWLLTLVVSGCGADGLELGRDGHRIIHGSDDRVEVFEVADPALRRIAERSVVALMPNAVADAVVDASWYAMRPTVSEVSGICADTRFADQPSHAFCSGILVDSDLVLTAEHCVPSVGACRSTSFVFDYRLDGPGAPAAIGTEDVYRCREVVARGGGGEGEDFAFVRLDRTVGSGRAPIPLDIDSGPSARVGDRLIVMGAPLGMPIKVDAGGRINREAGSSGDVILAALDTYGGNSGSPVFAEDLGLVGILVAGETDHVESERGCLVDNVRPDDRGREQVAPIGLPLSVVRQLGWPVGETGVRCARCASDADCPGRCRSIDGGSVCVDRCGSGACEPWQRCESGQCVDVDGGSSICSDAALWRRACGRQAVFIAACPAGQTCVGTACAVAPPGFDCGSAIRLPPGDAAVEGRIDGGVGGVNSGRCGGVGAELHYTLEVEQKERVELIARGLDTVLYIQTACGDPRAERACSDDDLRSGEAYGSRIEVELEPGRYTVVVDTYRSESGRVELIVDRGSSGCGCRTAGRGAGPAGAVAALLGVWPARYGRRRRRSEHRSPGEGSSDPLDQRRR